MTLTENKEVERERERARKKTKLMCVVEEDKGIALVPELCTRRRRSRHLRKIFLLLSLRSRLRARSFVRREGNGKKVGKKEEE